ARRQGGLEGPQAAGPRDPHRRSLAAEGGQQVRADRWHGAIPDEGRQAGRATSPLDLLQLFKTHPLVRGILEGGERVAWGAKALPGGGYWSMPKLTMPGALLVGDSAGMVDTVALKGVHHSVLSGKLAAESIYAA